MNRKNLATQWGKTWSEENLHTEYPRPQMVRDSYYCLNGAWKYAITQTAETEKWDGVIMVPFSPETALSGVERIVQPADYLHYKKNFILPDGWIRKDRRVLLHFGAVDQECEVYLNGTHIGGHRGGYLPFSFDVTAQLREENELLVTVRDFTEESPHARGKQKLVKKGHMSSIFYTPSSGIWKTVWMEAVPEQYIRDIRLTPDLDTASVRVEIDYAGDQTPEMEVEITYCGEPVAAEWIDSTKIRILEQQLHLWTPDNPELYDITITCGQDRVQSYFGMRKFHRAKDENGIWRFYLNNKPYFFNGVLDQGYWPESLLTPPTDEALQYDIRLLKSYGFNTIRKHVKIEADRFYYHCDKIGMVVWQDMPNGGGDYNMFFVTYLPNGLPQAGRMIRDNHYRLFRREDKAGREQYYKDLGEMVQVLYNHPSIAAWVPFNEGWGQFDAKKATKLILSHDTTRLINEACGWFDQGGGDMYSIHNYLRQLKIRPQKDRAVALTEFGGYAYPVAGHMLCEKEFGYKAYQSKEELTDSFCKLYETEIIPNIRNGLCSAIYTQTSDIEEEINGFVTYDRAVEKFDAEKIREVNEGVMREFENIMSGKQFR